ncbi:anti-sigma factor domain-containing protein [Dyadobacter sp. CY323]|uniref:anti-sigma factor n=1 Tax=Dyadobacter sp. CY323 TaxID=2907302 RepID=UPI001F48FB1B|nr:anti-sigma factor [Dyadobacter sp. CY323]MCE6988298.1 anti-sigma factor [Dyadobacter sp. CY323]
MNIQAYIESGILEEYVLGTVSSQEKQEVECMSHIYPEIKEELLRTESALEEYALKHQTAPPASLKESLFAKMSFDAAQEINDEIQAGDQTAAYVETISGTEPAGTIEPVRAEPKIIDNVFDQVETREVTPLWAKISVAAAVVLAILAGWSAVQMTEYKGSSEQLASEMSGMKTEMADMKSSLEYNQALATLYRNPEYKTIHLAGLEKSPQSSVSAFWNQKTNEVLIDVQNLPAAPSGKQYQLWSIVNGEAAPMDIGVIDNQFTGKVLKMKNTKPGSAAFAITLEKEGGVPSPTMTEMYVMGKV